MTQYLVEEALGLALELHEAAQLEQAAAEAHKDAAIARSQARRSRIEEATR